MFIQILKMTIKKDAWNLIYSPLSQKVLHTHFLEDCVNYIP